MAGQNVQYWSVYSVLISRFSTCPVCRESLFPGAPGFVDAPPPYPRSPLREFTPCAPGRSSPFYSLLIAHRLIVFANDRLDAAESVTGPMNPAIPLNETIASIIHPARRTVLCREFHKLLPILSCPGAQTIFTFVTNLRSLPASRSRGLFAIGRTEPITIKGTTVHSGDENAPVAAESWQSGGPVNRGAGAVGCRGIAGQVLIGPAIRLLYVRPTT